MEFQEKLLLKFPDLFVNVKLRHLKILKILLCQKSIGVTHVEFKKRGARDCRQAIFTMTLEVKVARTFTA